MATLTQYLHLLSKETDVEPATLRAIGRKLQEDGIINIAGRGSSVAHLNAVAVSSLLTATALLGHVRSIGDRVKQYFALKCQNGCRETFSRVPPGLRRENLTGTFGEALQAVLDFVAADVDVAMEVVQPFGRVSITFTWTDIYKTCRSTWSYGREHDFAGNGQTPLGRLVSTWISADIFHNVLMPGEEENELV